MIQRNNLTAPDRGIAKGKDPRKGRLIGDAIAQDLDAYDDAKVVLLGCPQDEGVRRNRGRPGADKAPREIRRQLYRFPAPDGFQDGELVDLGDVVMQDSLEKTHARQKDIVQQALADGKRVVVLGGGNDISYPDISALAAVTENPLAINVDSHFDVRGSEVRHSGTPYRQVLDEKILSPGQLIEVGCKPEVNLDEHTRYLREAGVRIIWLDELRKARTTDHLTDLLSTLSYDAIFWGIDMDAVRTSDAPGVSASYPIGLAAEDIYDIAAVAGADPRSRVLEISEINPEFDVDNRTTKLAAQVVVRFLRLTQSLPL